MSSGSSEPIRISRRALLAAASTLVLSGDTRRNADVEHTGPARQSPWYPGKPRPRPPDWLYENGLTEAEAAIARTVKCACSHPL